MIMKQEPKMIIKGAAIDYIYKGLILARRYIKEHQATGKVDEYNRDEVKKITAAIEKYQTER